MRLLVRLFRPAAPPEPGGAIAEGPRKPAARRVIVEWKDRSGQTLSQKALIQTDLDGKPRILVRRPMPFGLARIRETNSIYPVKVLATVSCSGGFELKLDYLGAGRRREDRMPAEGPALLEGDSLEAISVEVLDVSSGGMQLLSVRPANVGSTVRVSGSKVEYLGVVRHCSEVQGGFRIGVQLFGEDRLRRGS